MIISPLLLRRIPKPKRYPLRSFTTSRLYKQQQQHPPQQFMEQPRVNQLGIQYLSNDLHKKLFPTTTTTDYLHPETEELLEISKKHLANNELLGKKTQITEPITIKNFPELVGKSLDEHFHKLGTNSSEPYLSMAKLFLRGAIPEKPQVSDWVFQSGWTRYVRGEEPQSVEFPLEDELVFDVEVLFKVSKYPVMATCASSEAWYGWVSPTLIAAREGKSGDELDWNHLIPMNCKKKEKVIVGYNVSYDRARILEEYNIKQTKAFYLDGMALHVAVSGICSQQRPTWAKYDKNKRMAAKYESEEDGVDEGSTSDVASVFGVDASSDDELTSSAFLEAAMNDIQTDPWLLKGSPNSLANVAKFQCGIDLDKSDRKDFESEEPSILLERFNELMNYCAGDVAATFEVTKKLFPIFLERVPHPVSFAALRHLGNLILPTTTKWDKYIESAESCYEKNRVEVTSTIEERANDLIQFVVQENPDLLPDYESDPWLSQLNWTLKEAKLKKDGSLPKKRAYLTGYPEWYRDLFRGTSGRIMNLTLRTRITPLLLRLKWEGYPLFWVDSQGWCFKVPYGDQEAIEKLTAKNYTQPKLPEEEFDVLESLQSGGTSYVLFKVPHPDGPKARCTHVLSKQYVRYFEDGTLTSEYEHAHKILKLNNEASYWLSNRNRINDQFVVYNQEDKNKFFDTKKESKEHKDMAIILPNLATMGTITRRATENTWLTASNAKKDRIGSELKSLIEAPKGYCFIGADVDSEELWIASLVGDSMFEIHGGTALGWMTLEGEKSQKTDLHSKTSSILGISRNNAKVFNYGRIYGAGIKFASRLLKQFNASLSDSEADEIAKKLYDNTKGMTGRSKHFGANQPKLYYGGSESVMFNALEAIAQQDEPRTPVLGARITDALNVKNLRNNNYMTSRVNWTIQSSGVDYLHLLIVSMEYLSEKYGVDARLAITVHDELRYLVKEEDKYKAALLLQISNVWTRAMFCEQLGIKEVPQSCAFFSEVDIDFVLRKEVSMDCVTPSNPTPIPHGESLNIAGLLEKCRQGDILDDDKKKTKPLTLNRVKYTARKPVIYDLDKNLSRACKVSKIKLQSSNDAAEWKKNLYAFAKIKGQQSFSTDNVPSSKGKTSEEPKKPRKSYKKKNREILDIDLETKTEKKGKKEKYVASAKKTNYDDDGGKYLKPPYLREDMWKDEPIVTWHRTPPPPPSQPTSFAASSRPIYKKDGFSQYSTGSRSASSSSESQFKYHRRHASSLTPDRSRRGVRLRNEKRSEDYEVTK